MKIFEYEGELYPSYIKDGNAIEFALPAAKHFCKGDGLDIGGTEKWHFPGAQIINVEVKDEYHAMLLPDKKYDYIISSHCLEHLINPFQALEYWAEHIKSGGVMFLYLPHPDMLYWAKDCPKHWHLFFPKQIKRHMNTVGIKDVLISGRDMYWSFTAVGFKS